MNCHQDKSICKPYDKYFKEKEKAYKISKKQIICENKQIFKQTCILLKNIKSIFVQLMGANVEMIRDLSKLCSDQSILSNVTYVDMQTLDKYNKLVLYFYHCVDNILNVNFTDVEGNLIKPIKQVDANNDFWYQDFKISYMDSSGIKYHTEKICTVSNVDITKVTNKITLRVNTIVINIGFYNVDDQITITNFITDLESYQEQLNNVNVTLQMEIKSLDTSKMLLMSRVFERMFGIMNKNFVAKLETPINPNSYFVTSECSTTLSPSNNTDS